MDFDFPTHLFSNISGTNQEKQRKPAKEEIRQVRLLISTHTLMRSFAYLQSDTIKEKVTEKKTLFPLFFKTKFLYAS